MPPLPDLDGTGIIRAGCIYGGIVGREGYTTCLACRLRRPPLDLPSSANFMENDPSATATFDIAAPTATTPKLGAQVEDRAIEQYIKDSGRFLEETRLSPAILEILTGYGFGDEELSVGMSLQHEALQAYCAQHGETPKDLTAAAAELKSKADQARDDYAEFRLVARAAFPGFQDRMNLRVLGDAPDDLQRFVNAAHAAYMAASEALYTEKMTKRGYSANRLSNLNEFLDALTFLDAAHEAAAEANAPVKSTTDPLDVGQTVDRTARDAAYNTLKEFMKELKGVTRAAFRKQPEILAQLELTV